MRVYLSFKVLLEHSFLESTDIDSMSGLNDITARENLNPYSINLLAR